MSDSQPTYEVALTADDPRFATRLDGKLVQMRRLLAVMRPDSSASALKLLRDAYPDTPLGERLLAMKEAVH